MLTLEMTVIIGLGIFFTYIIAIFGGFFFVKIWLKFLKFDPNSINFLNSSDKTESDDDKGLPRAGLMIGMVERAIILTFGLANQFSAISFVFLAKSMTRFKQLEKREFAEYYLVGTLLSFFFALIVALIAQLIYTNYVFPFL